MIPFLFVTGILSIFNMTQKFTYLNVVNITESSIPIKVSAKICSGLFNRNNSMYGEVYTIENSVDEFWLNELNNNEIDTIEDIRFIDNCLNSKLVTGYLKYNFLEQKLILPQLITIAGVKNIIPIDTNYFDYNIIKNIKLDFDATDILKNASLYDSTLYIYNNYINNTTGLAKMDPGLDIHNHPFNPPLIGDINTGLIDFIVKKKLFNFKKKFQ